MVKITETGIGLICNHCNKQVSGGTYIAGVFYCPMCLSIIRANTLRSQMIYPMESFNLHNRGSCERCTNNPSNGGSGICHCILGAMQWR